MDTDLNPLQAGATPLTLDSARGMLFEDNKDQPAAAPVKEQPPAQPQAQEAEPAAEEAQPEQETTETETEEELPPLKAPAFWKKAARDVFEQLPRHAQEQLLEQERERNEGVERALREAADKRKSADTELTGTQTERQRLKAALDQLLPDLQSTLHRKWANVDWNKLAAEDRGEYVELRHQFETEMAQFQRARAERAQIAEREKAEADKAREETGRKEWEALTAKRTELKDPAKAKAFFESINAYALEMGYSPDRIANTDSHLDFLTLEKAMKYDQAQKARAEAVVKPLPKVQAPGSAKTKADRTAADREALMKRAEQTGEIRDWARLLRT
jgi:hypothetical protein